MRWSDLLSEFFGESRTVNMTNVTSAKGGNGSNESFLTRYQDVLQNWLTGIPREFLRLPSMQTR
jgi:hypothetical protein